MALVDGSAELYARGEIGQNSAELLARFEAGQEAEEIQGRMAIRHPTSSDLRFSLYVRPRHLTAAEMVIGGRDRRMRIR